MLMEELQNIKDDGPQDYELFVDLDGVLADFDAGISRVLGEPYSEERYNSDPAYKKAMWKAVTAHQKQHGGTRAGLWRSLPILEGGRLWDHVKIHDPQILSATGNPQHGAEPEKHEWVADHLGSDVKVNLVRLSKDKAQFAAPNRILIDDREKSIGPWEAAGGIGILHKNAADTIRKLKQFGL